MKLRSAVPALLLFILTAGAVDAQSFVTSKSRGESLSVAGLLLTGDWQIRNENTIRMHGGEIEWRRLGARFLTGENTNEQQVDQSTTMMGADFIIPFGPMYLSIGGEYTNAGDPDVDGVREFALPIYLANNAVLDFGTIWWHPTLALGASYYTRTVEGEDSSGFRPDGAVGIELGVGPLSVRVRGKHNMRAAQRGEFAVRLRF
jgi:hypothetical protein